MANKNYPAKLLLFGEYTVLVGSRALAIPVPRWYGEWKQGEIVDSGLEKLASYIEKSSLRDDMRMEAFQNDIKSGLRFESAIPWGYGLGSSAALTAAIYDKYRVKRDAITSKQDAIIPERHTHTLERNANKITKDGKVINEMIRELACIENYYHGHSSGLDPLVSYLNQPVLYENDTYYTIELNSDDRTPQIFLINSGIERFTAPLVALFKSKLTDPEYVRGVINPLKGLVDQAIDHFLHGSWELFWNELHLISEMQFSRFKEMLPEPIASVWQGMNKNPNIYLKLCGAGGGGYFLGFARPGIDVEDEIGCAVELINLAE